MINKIENKSSQREASKQKDMKGKKWEIEKKKEEKATKIKRDKYGKEAKNEKIKKNEGTERVIEETRGGGSDWQQG